MGFRQTKNKQERLDRVKWDAFYRANWDLFERIGLPLTVTETLDRFDDFLQNGYLDFYDDPLKFTVDKLDSDKFDLIKVLVERYFGAGFRNPWIGPEVVGGRAALNDLVRKYPDQFHEFDVKWANDHLEETEEA